MISLLRLLSTSVWLSVAALEHDPSIKIKVYMNGQWTGGIDVEVGLDTCLDTSVTAVSSLLCTAMNIQHAEECTVHTETGLKVTSCDDLIGQPFVSVVPSKERFIYIPLEIGREVPIQDISPLDKPVVLKTLSQKPKIFEIMNFFSSDDADFLISNALSIRTETHRLKRSTTGTENVLIDRKRTSESAFDVTSSVALKLKRRTQELLRYGPYDETMMDGFQILRYNVSAAYNSHLDYIESHVDVKYDTTRGGTNRFATVLFYLNDVEMGGETVFPNAAVNPADVHMVNTGEAFSVVSSVSGDSVNSNGGQQRLFGKEDVSAFLKAYNATEAFPVDGFERELLVKCRTRFSSRPKKLRAVLFYSQLPNLKMDPLSLHAGCPVVKGEKWLANLWIWNGPRHEFWVDEEGTVNGKVGLLRPQGRGQVVGPRSAPDQPKKVLVAFEAIDVVGAHLFWEEMDWGELQIGVPIGSNSYSGHKWSVRLNGEIVKTFVVPTEVNNEPVHFYLSKSDIN